MFFPKLRPSELVGQTMRVAATFLTVALVPIGHSVFSGPLFREGNRLFLMQTRRDGKDENSVLEIVEVPEGAPSMEVLSLAQQNELMVKAYEDRGARIEYLEEELKKDEGRITVARSQIEHFARQIDERDRTIADHANALEEANRRLANHATEIEEYRKANSTLYDQNVELTANAEVALSLRRTAESLAEAAKSEKEKLISDRDMALFNEADAMRRLQEVQTALTTARLEADKLATHANELERQVQRYVSLVGPLDPEETPDPRQPALELVPPPPPVVGASPLPEIDRMMDKLNSSLREEIKASSEEFKVMSMNQFLSEVESGGDPLGTGPIENEKTSNTIRREGSHTDEHFRRLMFLTGGDV